MKKLSELGISPAPWRFTNDDVIDLLECGVVYSNDCSYLGVADGNLIAAAPELYDMLQSLVEYIDRECIPCGETACELMTAAHNVLAKAAGEEVRDGK